MVNEQLQKKIDRAIKLLKGYDNKENPVEIAYSGGKDSDVILQLAKEAGINYRAIYKNTTIDPPKTIAHAKEMGAEILMPKGGVTFFKTIEDKGFPNRFRRFCCNVLKEYKVLDKAVIGVRREESNNRNNRYTEPTACRFFGNKKEHVEQIYPILDWTSEDVEEFIKDRNIKCAPVYYDEEGNFHVERRLGCMCCPMVYYKKRIEQFKQYPNMVKAYLKAGQKYRDTHPTAKSNITYSSVYEHFVRDVFFIKQSDFDQFRGGQLQDVDYKQLIENYFNIKL